MPVYDINGTEIASGRPETDLERVNVFLDTVAPYSSTDLAGYSGTVESFYSAYDQLVSDYPDYVSKTVLGKDQTNTYDICEYHFRPETLGYYNQNFPATETKNEVELPLFLMQGCIHGDEQMASWVLLNLMQKICNSWAMHPTLTFYRWNVEFRVIPIVNPWGFANNKRQNQKNYDLNRYFNQSDSWLESNCKETLIDKTWIHTYADSAYAFIDCHTAWAGRDRDLAWLISANDLHENVANSVITTLTRQWKAQYPSITYDGLMGYTGQSTYIDPQYLTCRNYAFSIGLENAWTFEFANTFLNLENTKFGPYTCNAYMDLFVGTLNALAQMMGGCINNGGTL